MLGHAQTEAGTALPRTALTQNGDIRQGRIWLARLLIAWYQYVSLSLRLHLVTSENVGHWLQRDCWGMLCKHSLFEG